MLVFARLLQIQYRRRHREHGVYCLSCLSTVMVDMGSPVVPGDTERGSAKAVLRAVELFAARSRAHSLPQRSHGQKDFIPDHSETQIGKLRQCREEQWQLLSEERVERLGSLVNAEWKPRKSIVELKSPAGKFWHTMGFTRRGKQCLQTEEAIYLLECGSIQLFYRGLPMSVQEAYETLLPCRSTSLLQYQVFSHLKRLGYILIRFDPSSVLSPYERQLNMESSRHKSSRNRRKRKHSPSPTSEDKKGKNDENKPCGERAKEGTFESAPVSQRIPAVNIVNEPWPSNRTSPAQNLTGVENRRISDEGSCPISKPDTQESTNVICSPKWDLTEITFPNLASDCLQNHLSQPDVVLLPENIIGREVDMSVWRGRINQTREKLSRKEQEQLEWESRYKNSINADVEVKQCCSWREYKDLLRRRTQEGARQRPPHLWNQAVTPLVQPNQATSTACLLEQIGILQTSHILDGTAQMQDEAEITIDFDVYPADAVADFKKSSPGKPYARMCVRRFDEEVPDLRALKQLSRRSGDVPVVFAVVDSGDIAFYSFKDFNLPVDLYP